MPEVAINIGDKKFTVTCQPGEESALEYIDHISDLLSDNDYETILEYVKKLKPEDTNPDKSEEDRLWRI